MSEVTHVRIIFPVACDPKHLIKTFWDEKENCFMGAVFHHNVYWKENVVDPNFAFDMEVHVGVERAAEEDLLGNVNPLPAQGLLRGEYARWEPFLPAGRTASGGWGWLVFRLRYDMQEGPEMMAPEQNGWTVYTTGQLGKFYYALERHDG